MALFGFKETLKLHRPIFDVSIIFHSGLLRLMSNAIYHAESAVRINKQSTDEMYTRFTSVLFAS